jgi:hypothetical protein
VYNSGILGWRHDMTDKDAINAIAAAIRSGDTQRFLE